MEGSGKPIKYNNEIELKKLAWQNKLKEVDSWADAVGLGIEDGIKETVVALNLSGFNTIQSCEGHLDSGSTRPWVTVAPYQEPDWKFNKQEEIFKEIAEKFGVPLEEVIKMRNWEAWQEAWNLSEKNGVTEEYKKWEKDTEEMINKIQKLLEEFYINRPTDQYARLTIGGDEGNTLTSIGDESLFIPVSDKKNLTDEDKEKILPKLLACRKEIGAFTNFLKDKYLYSK